MSASPFATIIVLNNRGIECFLYDLELASRCFRKALCILRKVLELGIAENALQSYQTRSYGDAPSPVNRSEPNQSVASRARRAIAVANAANTTTQQPHPPMSLTTTSTDSISSSGLPMSSLYICARPAKLEASSFDRERTDQRANIAALVVSFNLALAYHLMIFTSSPETASRYLRSAISFYEVAIKLRQTLQRREEHHRGRHTISVMDLSILNNIAVLYDQVGNDGGARVCFERLALKIRILDANSTTNDVTGFVKNIAMIGPYLLRTMPAAAA